MEKSFGNWHATVKDGSVRFVNADDDFSVELTPSGLAMTAGYDGRGTSVLPIEALRWGQAFLPGVDAP